MRIRGETRRKLAMSADVVLASISVLVAFLLRGNFELGGIPAESLALTTSFAGAAACLAFSITGTHLAQWRYVTIRDFGTLLAGATAAVLGFVALMFLWDRLGSVPRTVPIIQWLLLVVGLCGSRLVYAVLVGGTSCPPEHHPRARWEPVLLVGGGQGTALVAKLLQMAPESGWRPVGVLDERLTVGRMIANVPILGPLDDFRRVLAALDLRGMRPGRVVITAPHDEIGLEAILRLQEQARAEGVALTDLPALLRFGGAPVPSSPPAEERLQAAMARLEHRSYLGAKRLIDVAVSLAVLLAAAPLLALIAAILSVSVGSPVLFRQVRGGRGGLPFVMVKFRTMRDAYGPDGQPLPDALRTPWIGRFLRRTRFDELPQFWNVLIGHMSLVGPRPLVERELAELPGAARERSTVRPGITGWAQVRGGRLLDLEAKLALDVWYVRHASLRLDATILLLTVRMILLGDRVGDGVLERIDAAHA
jgi:lipopolysaccharide/colanic/teichoic acid biosynthesis glycosyltransferase